jgi:Uma2 family endonuclease
MATDTLAPTLESPPIAPPVSAVLRAHRFTVDEYQRMAAAGVFGPDPKLELIDGTVIDKMTKKPPHVAASLALDRWLHRNAPPGFVAACEAPLTIAERQAEPEPDAMIVRGDPLDFGSRRITPADVHLVVEISESSLEVDRGTKLALYASVGIPAYWILNLAERQLEIYSRPFTRSGMSGYSVIRLLGEAEDAPLEIEGQEVGRVTVRELLPRQ